MARIKEENASGNNEERDDESLLKGDMDDQSPKQETLGNSAMDNPGILPNDDLGVRPHKLDSRQRVTADQERMLWRKYAKWRQIHRIPATEMVLQEATKVSSAVRLGTFRRMILRTLEEIAARYDLIVLVRRYVGLDRLGDVIIEDTEDSAKIAIELYRLIQYSKNEERKKMQTHDSESCCLEDLFGSILGQTVNNVAFGKGNPSLVGSIATAIKRSPTDVKNELFELAVNRELLPISIVKLFRPKTSVRALPNLTKFMPRNSFSNFVSNEYKSFILNIRSEGKDALNTIIESHLWLAEEIAQGHVCKASSLSLEDLIQEGSLGLIEAAERYRPTRGTRFIQYAYWFVLRAIQRGIADTDRIIRVPVYMVETIDQLQRIRDDLAWRYGRESTLTEIAKEMQKPLNEVEEIVQLQQLPLSLESAISEEEAGQFDEFMSGLASLSLFDLASQQQLREQIEEVLSELTPREQRVLELRFGLKDGRSRTLEEVGMEFDLTRERIRQIEGKALKRLRHPTRSRKFKEYLE